MMKDEMNSCMMCGGPFPKGYGLRDDSLCSEQCCEAEDCEEREREYAFARAAYFDALNDAAWLMQQEPGV